MRAIRATEITDDYASVKRRAQEAWPLMMRFLWRTRILERCNEPNLRTDVVALGRVGCGLVSRGAGLAERGRGAFQGFHHTSTCYRLPNP